jgi:hypothetical protein
MHPVIRSIAIGACLLVAAPAGELAPELAPLAQSHTTATEALAEQRAAELARLRKPYLEALAAADQAATEAGDTAALREIEPEREAVNQGKLRAEMPKALPRKLSPVRRARVSAEPKAHAEFDKKQKALDAAYLQKLGALQAKAAGNAGLTEQIAAEKSRVVSGIHGAITTLKSDLAGTKWRLFEGEGFEELRFGVDGKVNGNWKYEITGRDKVKVIWDKSSAMSLTLGRDGASLAAGDKTWVLDRE